VAVAFGKAQAIRGFALEVELDENGRPIAHDPCIMTGVNRNHLRRGEFETAAIRVMDVDLAASEEAHVSVHTELSANDGFHVSGLAEAGWIDRALHSGGAYPDYIKLDTAVLAVIGIF
jgi:hypothetical protein